MHPAADRQCTLHAVDNNGHGKTCLKQVPAPLREHCWNPPSSLTEKARYRKKNPHPRSVSIDAFPDQTLMQRSGDGSMDGVVEKTLQKIERLLEAPKSLKGVAGVDPCFLVMYYT